MAVAKVILNGNTLIDVTDKTVASSNLVSPNTALGADGTTVTGALITKSASDVTVSGATTTIPAGVYSSQVQKTVSNGTEGMPTATKGTVSSNSVSVTPSVTNTTGYITGGTKTGTPVTVSASELVSGTKTISSSGITDVTNYASASVASGSATTPATTITANPTISISSDGLITASISASQSVTPTVSAGYVSSGTAGTVSVSGSNTSQLTTQTAQTIHPSTTDQTIASGKYLTGTQTVKGILLTNLSASNIAKDVVVKVGDSTDDDCVTSVTGTYEGSGGGGGGLKKLIEQYTTITSFSNSEISIIGSYAFNNCTNLTTVSFPSCTSIGNFAFQYCSSLTTVSFPLCKSIGGYAFNGCSSLITASFPSCTSIGTYAFNNCINLTTASFPSCKSIASYAFRYCSSLTTVSFPSCTSISNYAFQLCTRLTTASFPSCTRIGSSAFGNCISLTTASFPSCTSIGSYAFQQCFLLLSLYLTGSSVVSLVNSNAFASTPIAGYTTSTGGVYGSIFVPSSLYSTYKASTNWTFFSSRFVSV